MVQNIASHVIPMLHCFIFNTTSIHLFHTFLCNSQNYHPRGVVDDPMRFCLRQKAKANSASGHWVIHNMDGATVFTVAKKGTELDNI